MKKRIHGSGQVFSGIRWNAVGQVARQGIRFLVSVILASLLAPEDFGLLGMASVITGFIGIFYSLGTTGAIIQRKELSAELLSSLFIINVVIGLFLAGSLALSGPFVAMVYETSGVAPILQVLGLTFVISSFGMVHRSLLQRNLCFDRLVQIEFMAAVVQGVTAIALASAGWKVWSLVAASIMSSIVSTCLLCWASPWRFQWDFRWSEVRHVVRFSLNLTGAQTTDYFLRNTDKFIIGRFLGSTLLGYYSMAHSLSMVPQEATTRVLNRVLFPVFSRMQDDMQFRNASLRAIGGIALLTFPMAAGLAVVAHPFVKGFLGEKWSPIIPLVMIFAVIAMLRSIAGIMGNVCLAKGRSDWLFRWNLGAGSVIIASFFCGLPWGIVGVALAYAIVMLPLTSLSFVILFRLINLPFMDIMTTLHPYAGASAVMAGLVLACRLVLENMGCGALSVLVICVPMGSFIYTSLILFWRPAAFADIVKVLPGGFQRLIGRVWLTHG